MTASSTILSHRLVMIEWEDSAQPIPGWMLLREFEPPSITRCVSVGWLIHDNDGVKALAPNMANIDSDQKRQVSAVIRIPERAVTRIVWLAEQVRQKEPV
jgi:hypothetical protein